MTTIREVDYGTGNGTPFEVSGAFFDYAGGEYGNGRFPGRVEGVI
jgi:hypothetical protein